MSNQSYLLDESLFVDRTTEQALIGLVLSQRRIPPALRCLREEHFADEAHRALWSALVVLHASTASGAEAADDQRLLRDLQAAQPAGGDYLQALSDACPDLDVADLYVHRLLELYDKRRLWEDAIETMREVRDNAYTGVPAHELRRRRIAALQGLELSTPAHKPATWADLQALGSATAWDWPGWIPRGGLVLLAGESGIGKSLLALRLAACYLVGAPWPDACLPARQPADNRPMDRQPMDRQHPAGLLPQTHADNRPMDRRPMDRQPMDRQRPAGPLPGAPPSSPQDCPRREGSFLASAVLWCESEAGQFLHLERARAWGLPCEQIWTPLKGARDVQLAYPEHRAAVARLAARPQVRLIVVNSLGGAARSAENTTRARRVVQWLAELARDTGTPVLLLHHLRKRAPYAAAAGGPHAVQLDDLRGRGAIVPSARVVLALDAPDPERPQLRRFSVVKSSLGAPPPPLGFYAAAGSGGGPQLRFCDPPELPRPASRFLYAVECLRDLLAQGPLPATTIQEQLVQAGISKRTAHRAKAHLGIRSTRQNDCWHWRLPSSASEPALMQEPPADDR